MLTIRQTSAWVSDKSAALASTRWETPTLEMTVPMTVVGKEKQSQVEVSVKAWAAMPLLPLRLLPLQPSLA